MPEEIVLTECDECGITVNDGTELKEVEGKKLCPTCFEGKTKICPDCGERFFNENLYSIAGKLICADCRDVNYSYCEDCFSWYHNDEINYYDDLGRSLCDNCYDNSYGACECGHVDHQNNLTYFDGRYYCSDYRRDNLVECSRCSEWEHNDDAFYDESDDSYYCRRCYENGYARSNRSLHDYNYCPDPTFHHHKLEENKKTNKLYMGMELEVEVETRLISVDDIISTLEDHLTSEGHSKKIYFKRDGSLTNGFEMVTHPMTLRWIKKELKLNKLLDILRNKNVSSYKKGTCGFHVHLSKNFFEGMEVDKMRLFINKNYGKIYDFSKRKGTGDNYIKKENYDIKQFKDCVNQSGRYWAFNLNTHKETVEIRIFRGTLSYKRLVASLEFCDALAHYVKQVSFMKAGDWKSWDDFLGWCKKENRYHKFLTVLNYQPVTV